MGVHILTSFVARKEKRWVLCGGTLGNYTDSVSDGHGSFCYFLVLRVRLSCIVFLECTLEMLLLKSGKCPFMFFSFQSSTGYKLPCTYRHKDTNAYTTQCAYTQAHAHTPQTICLHTLHIYTQAHINVFTLPHTPSPRQIYLPPPLGSCSLWLSGWGGQADHVSTTVT